MASNDSDFSDIEANAEVDDGEGIVNEGLPSGSERDLIEYYFNRGLTYRQITLMLGKHHHLDMERTYIETKNERLFLTPQTHFAHAGHFFLSGACS